MNLNHHRFIFFGFIVIRLVIVLEIIYLVFRDLLLGCFFAFFESFEGEWIFYVEVEEVRV
jgi:hypothetical protein